MSKVFLYLYPVKEYFFLVHEDAYYELTGKEKPLPILNEAIDRRYRKKGYQVVFALFPDRVLYGVEQKDGDKVIYTDISFSEVIGSGENVNTKVNFVPKYPSESHLINQLGAIDELVIGGFHASDCVKRVAEYALNSGIPTLVDLDLTDMFFGRYNQKDYFDIDSYSPARYIEYLKKQYINMDCEEFFNRILSSRYSSPVYGFVENGEVIMGSQK